MLKKICLPQCCARSSSGILIGTSNEDNTVLCIVAVVHFPITPRSLNSYLSKYEKLHRNIKLQPLGTWISNESENKDEFGYMPKLFRQKTWVSVKREVNDDGAIVFTANIHELQSTGSNSIFGTNNYVKSNSDFIVIIYNQKNIWDGELCNDSFLSTGDTNGCIEELFSLTSACKNGILSYEHGINSSDRVTVTHCCIQRELSLIYFLLSIFITVLLRCIHIPLYILNQNILSELSKSTSSIRSIWDKLTELTSLLSHAGKRFSQFEKSLTCLFGNQTKIVDSRKRYENEDIIATVFVDMILGLSFVWSLYYLEFLPTTGTTKEIFLPYVESIASQVEELIKWLMGIPAGLKLNLPLNQFLGHFFLYHVRLWLEYAKMMMEFFPHLITYCLMTSCLGLTFLLSIIADTVSTLSFHVYCFYVYAGRLYGLQVAGLLSLWRLFRGKKWNPLRKRVDSLEESGQRADQLFAGTLLFTVLLFLLPTTALYYGIFMLLRVAVLAIQVILSGLIFIISEFPWYSMLMRIFLPHKFIQSMKCSVIETLHVEDTQNLVVKSEEDQVIIMQMTVQPKSIDSVVMSTLRSKRQSRNEVAGFRTFLGKLIFGELVRWS